MVIICSWKLYLTSRSRLEAFIISRANVACRRTCIAVLRQWQFHILRVRLPPAQLVSTSPPRVPTLFPGACRPCLHALSASAGMVALAAAHTRRARHAAHASAPAPTAQALPRVGCSRHPATRRSRGALGSKFSRSPRRFKRALRACARAGARIRPDRAHALPSFASCCNLPARVVCVGPLFARLEARNALLVSPAMGAPACLQACHASLGFRAQVCSCNSVPVHR